MKRIFDYELAAQIAKIISTGILCLLGIGGWLTHLYVCFYENHWGFLIAGAVCIPIAIIHGWGIWLGFWH